jgi:uncharacterized protein YycO
VSIRIQLVTEQWNPISAAIRYTTRSWASHAEFVSTDMHFTLGARSDGGVRERPCSIDHYSKIEQFTVNYADPETIMRAAFEWARTQEGKPYDYSAITGIALDRDIHNEDKWFCSELIFVAFEKVGFPLLSTRPSDVPYRVTPRDLLMSRQLVYLP